MSKKSGEIVYDSLMKKTGYKPEFAASAITPLVALHRQPGPALAKGCFFQYRTRCNKTRLAITSFNGIWKAIGSLQNTLGEALFAERSLRLMDADAHKDFLGLALVGTMVLSQYLKRDEPSLTKVFSSLKPKDTQRLFKTAGYPYFVYAMGV